MTTTPFTIACYENAIPSFVAGKLEHLYGSMYASFAHFGVYGGLDDASTYICSREAEIEDIFLYRYEQRSVRVINEQMRLSDTSINRFADAMFDRYPEVDRVIFHAIDAQKSKPAFPSQRYTCTNDITMPLPGTVDEYYASLGKSTRKTLNQNGNRLQRRYDSFRFSVLEAHEFSDTQLREIISLNHARMAGKSRVSAIDEAEASHIIAFAKQCGLVGIISIEGRIRAGAICYRIGDHYHLRVIGHDPEYNAYGLGMLCCYRTVCESIVRGGTMFHFMWGQEEYKYRLLGVQREMAHIVLYRSRLAMALNSGTVVQTLLHGWRQQSHMWLLERLRHKDHWSVRFMHGCIALMRACKRTGSGLIRGKKPVTLQLSERK